MSAASLLREAAAAALVVDLRPDGSLSVRGPRGAREKFRPRFSQMKAEVVLLLRAEAAPEVRRCSCGAPAHFGEGWSLCEPGGTKWFCAECRPSREEIVSVAGDPEGSMNARRGHDEPRLDWWRQPVEGWASGRLEIHNMLTGVTTVVDLRGGQ